MQYTGEREATADGGSGFIHERSRTTGTAAALASIFVSRLVRHRVALAIEMALLLAIGLLLVSVLAWRLHAPDGVGNGG